MGQFIGNGYFCLLFTFFMRYLFVKEFLRRYFLYDRSLLSDLSRCGWESLKAFFQETLPEEDAAPGAVIAIQSFGDFLGLQPHS